MTSAIADATHVYDLTSGVWTEWLTWIIEQSKYVGWRLQHHMFAFGKHLMGDRDGSTLYEVSTAYATDVDSRPIRWLRRCPLPWDDSRRVFIPRLEVLLEPGLGLTTGQGSDPQITMRLSYNGGKTFGPERWRAAGAMGKYDARATFTRCGSGARPVVEVTMTDPVPWRLVGLEAQMHTGEGLVA